MELLFTVLAALAAWLLINAVRRGSRNARARKQSRKEAEESKRRARHYFDALHARLGPAYRTLELTAEDREFMALHGYGEAAVRRLISRIMIHLGMPYSDFRVMITDGTDAKTAGTYQHDPLHPTIGLQLRPGYTAEQIIAIVCHECSHHFLNVKKLKGASDHGNELLTDYAAVYTGLGPLLRNGYQDPANLYREKADRTRVGYITADEIDAAMSVLREYGK